jgi:hypothetical protein
MVAAGQLAAWTLAQQEVAEPPVPEPTRTILLMALLGIALVGLLLVVFILLGGHWVRRLGSHRRGPSVPPDVDLRAKDASPPPPRLPHRKVTDGDTLSGDDTLVS